MLAVWKLVTNRAGTILAFGAYEHTVVLWDLQTFSRQRTLETTFDCSLALNDDGSILYTTAVRWKGVAAYCTSDGSELWRRTDLGGRLIRISKDQRLLYCFGKKSCETLNRLTGKSKRLFRGVHDLWECPTDEILFLEKKGRFDIQNSETKAPRKVARCSFGTLDVAFSSDRIFVSESGGPLRCLDLHSGKEVWRHVPPANEHYLQIAFSTSTHRLVTVRWNYSCGGPYQLFHFRPESGDHSHVADVESDGDVLFCLDGTVLVSRKGRVYDATTGALLTTLPFGNYLGKRSAD
jgi:WD40 repeat protein